MVGTIDPLSCCQRCWQASVQAPFSTVRLVCNVGSQAFSTCDALCINCNIVFQILLLECSVTPTKGVFWLRRYDSTCIDLLNRSLSNTVKVIGSV